MSAPDDPGTTAALDGLRVLDLTTFLSGPYGTQILADLGADVVKVEPLHGDASRSIPPHFLDGSSAYFHSVNRNKRSIATDLKSPDGQALLRRLAAVADVVVENYRPGVMDRLGLTYDALTEANPGVVWCSISGFGQDGPYRDRPAYDMIVQAMSGGMSLTGMPDGPSVRSGIPLGDLSAGMFAVIGILAALHKRGTTKIGRRVDISMFDCQISMLSYQGAYHLLAGASPGRQGRAHDSIPTYRAYSAGDGDELMVTANTQGMWEGLCQVLELPELTDDPRFREAASRQLHRAELDLILEQAFLRKSAGEWLPLLLAAHVPAAPVNSVAAALQDPQTELRRMVVDIPADGVLPALRLLGNPVKYPGHVDPPMRRPPRLGADLQSVVGDWLDERDDLPGDRHRPQPVAALGQA